MGTEVGARRPVRWSRFNPSTCHTGLFLLPTQKRRILACLRTRRCGHLARLEAKRLFITVAHPRPLCKHISLRKKAPASLRENKKRSRCFPALRMVDLRYSHYGTWRTAQEGRHSGRIGSSSFCSAHAKALALAQHVLSNTSTEIVTHP